MGVETPSNRFVDRVKELTESIGLNERAVCRDAKLKSESQIARSRSARSPMQWDHVAAVTQVIMTLYPFVNRDWLLFGEGKMTKPGAALVRLGPGADEIRPKGVRVGKRRREPRDAAHATPAPREHRNGPK